LYHDIVVTFNQIKHL